jgi:hypothetical protein
MTRDELIKLVRAEWRALYGRLSARTGRLIQQQWNVLLYTTLFFGGIVAFMHTQGLSALGGGERWIIRTLSWVVLAAGIILLSLLQWNLRNTRKRVLEIEDRFLIIRRYVNRLNGWERMQRWGSSKFFNRFPFYILFLLALVAGFLFVHWYLRSEFLLRIYFRCIPQ